MPYKIEDNINLPPRRSPKRPREYPFEDLQMGQGFRRPMSEYNRIANAANYWGRKLNRYFEVRMDREHGEVLVKRTR